jgi:alpha-tubulin suppressor-like RCC1 family protein
LAAVAVSTSGDIYQWGYKFQDPDEWPTPAWNTRFNQSPTNLTPGLGEDFVAVALAQNTLIALADDGDIWTFGANNDGLMGTGAKGWLGTWEELHVSGVDWVSIASTWGTAFALDDEGQLWTWGYPLVAAQGVDAEDLEPVAPEYATVLFDTTLLVDTTNTFVRLDGDGHYVSLIDDDGDVYTSAAWGDGYFEIDGYALEPWSRDIEFVAGTMAIDETGQLLRYSDETWGDG